MMTTCYSRSSINYTILLPNYNFTGNFFKKRGNIVNKRDVFTFINISFKNYVTIQLRNIT